MFCCSSREDGKPNERGSKALGEPVQPVAAVPSAASPWAQYREPPPATQPNRPVGVGIVFQPDSTGALHVKSLAVGGPAEESDLVQIGDVLHEIDGHHVYRKPVGQLAPLILGQEGTFVRLGLQRESAGGVSKLVDVQLRRGWSLQSGQTANGTIPATPSKMFSHPLPQVFVWCRVCDCTLHPSIQGSKYLTPVLGCRVPDYRISQESEFYKQYAESIARLR